MSTQPLFFQDRWNYERSKKTGWIDGSQTPVRVGVYQRFYIDLCTYFCYWDGKVWGMGWYTAEKAWRCRRYKSATQGLPWRGLIENKAR